MTMSRWTTARTQCDMYSNDRSSISLERNSSTVPAVSVALGEIIHQVSGIKADKFAERHLFKPLGVSRYIWSSNASGFVRTGSGLGLRPRDMAKIGYLYLNGGRWQGKQIVSEAWVKESIENR